MASDVSDGLIGMLILVVVIMVVLSIAFIAVVVIVTGFAYSVQFWGTGVVITFILFSLWKRNVVHQACSLPWITEFIDIDISQSIAKSMINSDAISAFSKKKNPILLLLPFTILITLLLFLAQYHTSPIIIPFPPAGASKQPLSVGLSTTALLVGSGMGITFYYLLVRPRHIIEQSIRKRLERNLYHIEYAVDSHGELHKKVEELKEWYTKFSVRFIDDYISNLNTFITEHKIKILSDKTVLESQIATELQRVEHYLQAIKTSYALYSNALSLYEETFIAVNQSQRASLLDSLDKIVIKLKEDLPQLITHKRFAEFDSFIQQAISFLKNIQYNAEHGKGSAKNDSSGSQTSSHMNFNNPYELLGVTPEMTLSQIKKVYHQLSKIYHADLHSDISDTVKRNMEDRMKQINAAFEQIEKEKTKVA